MLSSSQSVPDVPLTPLEARIEQAKEKKEAGNKAFVEGDYRKASFQYKQVAILLSDLHSKGTRREGAGDENEGFVNMFKHRSSAGEGEVKPTPQQQDDIDALFATTQSNLAGAHLKLGRYSEAKVCATQALRLYRKLKMSPAGAPVKVDGSPIPLTTAENRAHFRRAQSQMHMGNFEEALNDLAVCDQEDVAVIDLLRMIREMKKKAVEREKQIFARMFAQE